MLFYKSRCKGTKNPRHSHAGELAFIRRKSNLAVPTAKVSIFSDINALSADFFIFHPKREAIAHVREATDAVFPLWAPNCHLAEWQFGSFFAENPHLSAVKVPFYRRFRGAGREKAPHCCLCSPHRPTLPRQLPPFIERNM